MEADSQRGIPAPQWRLTKDREAAVSLDYYWQPMSTCPHHTKVQLLTIGGVAMYGKWNGRDDFYVKWAPVPKVFRG